jgi:hypothetical protein
VDVEGLKDILYAWADGRGTGASGIIWLDQNAPRPGKPYLGMRLQSFVRIGQDAVSATADDQGRVTVYGNREFTLHLEWYGPGPMQKLEDLASSLELPSVTSYMFQNDVAFVDRLGQDDISELLDSEYESRGFQDLLMRVANIQLDPATGTVGEGYIETVNVGRTVKVGDDTVVDDVITIPEP